MALGVKRENIILCDTPGRDLSRAAPDGMNQYKEPLANDMSAARWPTRCVGADVFVGLSVAGRAHPGDGAIDGARIRSSSRMANPDPEISLTKRARRASDAIIATGRSDYPNQVNNVLGFPSSSAARWTCAPRRSTRR